MFIHQCAVVNVVVSFAYVLVGGTFVVELELILG